MDICLILLVLIIIVTSIIIYKNYGISVLPATTAIGGAIINAGINNKSKKLFIGDNAKLVVDGHNMIHELIGNSKPTVIEFENALKKMSGILTNAFATQDIHIVIKNPKPMATKIYNKIKNSKKNKSENTNREPKKKKTSEERIPYFRELVSLSKTYPRITYHLAYGKETKRADTLHYLKSRDDFLTIYLAKGHYMISRDRYKDFKDFSGIKSFKHYSVTNGNIHPKETIHPRQQYTSLEKPSIGNHFIFQLLTKKELDKQGIKNGDIYLNSNSVFGCLYLATDEKQLKK